MAKSINEDVRVVVGIDFGTTFSTYAYAHKENKNDIFVNSDWKSFYGRSKTPTTLLYNEHLKLLEWGFSTLSGRQKKARGLHWIELFKLCLMKSAQKPTLPLRLDFETAISDYLHKLGDSIKQTLESKWPGLKFFSQVLLVLTVWEQVPAEYDKVAINIMRECALKANLIKIKESPYLIFTTEPEAASIHCMKNLKEYKLKIGDSFMVVDCGGGTVDLSTKILSEGEKLNEPIEQNGEDCGGSFVDKEFLKFLGKKVGQSAIEKVTKEHHGDLQRVIQEFWQFVKIPFTGESENFESYELNLVEICPVMMQYVDNGYKKKMEEDEWVVTIEFDDVQSMFDPVIEKILGLVRSQLGKREDCSAMILVGGFSESKYLQSRIKKEFSASMNNKIFVPPEPMVAIVKGAVKFGLNRGVIADRILKWTYGTDILTDLASNVFDTMVKKGTRVSVDEKVTRVYKPVSKDQMKIGFDLYTTNRDNAKFCNDPHVNLLGKFAINIPLNSDSRSILYSLCFGTEIQATATNIESGEKYETTFELDI
ncbi:hypothetical protein Glove_707g31 [Diversispora epigaea]|uniref:Actin-like ATPase domain-containing protein n=1 Tax=Diversispora epigaea TaxID=1348612 RepID=A0A397G5S0_9GLOM|nr:hypothetical protein Glove_707g31 [Diversispora epigaea]